MKRQMWTLDTAVYQAWARRGLELGAENIAKLSDLCRANQIRMIVVVYPWPAQIYYGDKNILPVQFWRAFCLARGIRFLDLFPAFVPEGQEKVTDVLGRYFTMNDVHWNPAGHKLVTRQLIHVMH